MVEISVKSDIKRLTRSLSRLHRRQIPFATAGALNDTAFGVRTRIVKRTWPRSVTVRNRRFMAAALRIRKATKKRLMATIFDRLGRPYLELLTKGGRRRAERGGRRAVPSRHVRRTASGKVRKGDKPRTITARPTGIVTRLKRANEAILQRQRGGRVRLMYTLVDSVRMPRAFPFYEDAAQSVARQFPRHFARRLARAIATAR